jgi:hypothetical protein
MYPTAGVTPPEWWPNEWCGAADTSWWAGPSAPGATRTAARIVEYDPTATPDRLT